MKKVTKAYEKMARDFAAMRPWKVDSSHKETVLTNDKKEIICYFDNGDHANYDSYFIMRAVKVYDEYLDGKLKRGEK